MLQTAKHCVETSCRNPSATQHYQEYCIYSVHVHIYSNTTPGILSPCPPQSLHCVWICCTIPGEIWLILMYIPLPLHVLQGTTVPWTCQEKKKRERQIHINDDDDDNIEVQPGCFCAWALWTRLNTSNYAQRCHPPFCLPVPRTWNRWYFFARPAASLYHCTYLPKKPTKIRIN